MDKICFYCDELVDTGSVDTTADTCHTKCWKHYLIDEGRDKNKYQIAREVWLEWVGYMNEYEPCPMGDHRVPLKLIEWLESK